MTDVAVVGTGPAGCAAALALLAHGRSVILIGGGSTSRGFEATHAALESLLERVSAQGCLATSGAAPCRGVEAQWGSATTRTASTPSFLIDRALFDSELHRTAVSRGALTRRGMVTGATRAPDGSFRISLLEDIEVEARAVIDATGRAARVARSLGAELILGQQLVAICTEIPAEPREWVAVQTAELGWWYRVPGPGSSCSLGVVTLAAAAKANSLSELATWRRALELGASRLMNGTELDQARIRSRPAGSSRLDGVAGAGWACVGDAAMAFEPLASAGVTKAVSSGLAGAEAIHAWLQGDSAQLRRYQLQAERHWEAYVRVRRSEYATESRWRGEVWTTLRRA